MGVELQVFLRGLFLVVLDGVEEEVFFVVDGGVGLAWVDGRVVGVVGWGDKGYGWRSEWDVGKGSGGCG